MILCPMPRTILVVDDDPHIRQLLVFALAKQASTRSRPRTEKRLWHRPANTAQT